MDEIEATAWQHRHDDGQMWSHPITEGCALGKPFHFPRYETKDSGERQQYDSGMQRDTEAGKPRFSLMIPKGVPFQEQFLTRFAALLARGAEKYDPRNWEKAEGEVELERYHSSAFRHLIQWIAGETDEDHAAAVAFNLLAAETVKFKQRQFVEEFKATAKQSPIVVKPTPRYGYRR